MPSVKKANKEGQVVTEYIDDCVEDVVLTALLRQAYDIYRLFNGPCNAVLDTANRQALMDKLDAFYPQVIKKKEKKTTPSTTAKRKK